MAHINSLAPHVSGTSFGQIIVDAFADIKAAYTRRATYSRAYNELYNMSDRDLADIGVARRSIRDIAMKTAGERV